MRIAVTYEDDRIFQHFGRTQQFKLYDVAGGRIVSSQVVGVNGSGHGALVGVLGGLGADALICGGIGGGAQAAMAAAGIRVYGGVSGSADEAAEALASGTLDYDPQAQCDHHHDYGGHPDGEGCGSHGCGGHPCGS